MSLPPDPIPAQAKSPASCPDQPRCPLCGAPFPLHLSGVLDMVLLAKDVLSDLQAALEVEVLP
jgi:hypothetical protein